MRVVCDELLAGLSFYVCVCVCLCVCVPQSYRLCNGFRRPVTSSALDRLKRTFLRLPHSGAITLRCHRQKVFGFDLSRYVLEYLRMFESNAPHGIVGRLSLSVCVCV